MSTFITEDYLRDKYGLAFGSEVQLPEGCRLTPSAQALLSERKIAIRYINEQGEVFVADKDGSATNKVHPLKTNNQRPSNGCWACGSDVEKKPSFMTHLNDEVLVPKNHPRIALRGKIDSVICQCVEVQCLLEDQPPFIVHAMSDIRSYFGQILQAEVMEQPLPLPSFGDIDSETIHQWSHNPLKYLGYDHMLPDAKFGLKVAKLNTLRATTRELELEASRLFIDISMRLEREDIVAGLNRLSSAIYVVMILVWQCQNGQQNVLERLVN
ncbi:ATP-binding protein [Vibrio sp. MACH09]|uniref:ethanolamine utilization cob(I)yrinic acid a,c-diamide adenosyltransferase EutT n=1 Tax=unclassified Vibrio TaxID=2614977 RepID=UPI0014933DDE|nr:ethanolamine utilization cob(I)yrinic acid a,c-diamide adenosyltransferase EutT [Vibrio sp. MACH09]NOI67605.1 ethanolamine utilization cob(I)yrinic acid a,c-diamide adenosyltransferase EutT [Vibrio sp. 99-8-1]GLO61260.1 ATP-binding protein [Vibrio sp. MACH09]